MFFRSWIFEEEEEEEEYSDFRDSVPLNQMPNFLKFKSTKIANSNSNSRSNSMIHD